MRSNYRRIGDYIKEVKVRNSELKAEELLGINIDKFFMPSVANIIGTDLSVYKLVKKNHFACNRMHVGRDYRLPVSLSKSETDFMVSPAYDVFEIIDTEKLDPEFLMMWFTRREFDRNAWFYTDADVRGGLPWKSFLDMTVPIPSITKQREIVKEYNVVQNRIALNQQLIQKLEETAQTIYKRWFVEFEFPDEEGRSYKSSGGDMVWCEELGKEVPEGWKNCILKEVTNCLDYKRRPLSEEERNEFKGNFPYYGAMGIVDYVKEFLFEGEYLLFSEDGVNVIDAKGHPSVFLVWGKFWVNNHAHVLEGLKGYSTRFIYLMLKEVNVSDLVTGAAQPKINQENMNSITMIKPKSAVVRCFDKLINPIFENYTIRIEQNQRLSELKELLLSKLATIEN